MGDGRVCSKVIDIGSRTLEMSVNGIMCVFVVKFTFQCSLTIIALCRDPSTCHLNG